MQNAELKLELRDPELARALLHNLRAPLVVSMHQVDTYFRVPEGRLKRRHTADDTGHTYPVEYVFYHRADRAVCRVSRFTIYTESEARRHFGAADPPIWVEVVKQREVYMHEGVRIHLDRVDGLGMFVEFEALVTPQCNLLRGTRLVESLRKHLGPALGEPLGVSYADLLAAEARA